MGRLIRSPVRMRIGDNDEVEIGVIEADTAKLSRAAIARLLRKAADEFDQRVGADDG